jgi:pyruvate ferredoxin oxidoreductase beta subunit
MFFGKGHGACCGCPLPIAVRNVLEALEGRCFVVNPTGCLEIISSQYGKSAWGVPYIHSTFENAPSVASGIAAALEVLGREDEGHVVVFAGDGATADIGVGYLSSMLHRNDNVLYICLDNEAYMNTGSQQSSQTPLGAHTTTTPAGRVVPGKVLRRKDMVAFALAHGTPYVATASVAFPRDLRRKAKRAVEFRGAKYIHVHCPCPTGWYFDPSKTIQVAKLAYETALFPIVEFEYGRLVRVRKIKKRKPVEEYLKVQGRFRHLFKHPEGSKIIAELQKIADENVVRYGLET